MMKNFDWYLLLFFVSQLQSSYLQAMGENKATEQFEDLSQADNVGLCFPCGLERMKDVASKGWNASCYDKKDAAMYGWMAFVGCEAGAVLSSLCWGSAAMGVGQGCMVASALISAVALPIGCCLCVAGTRLGCLVYQNQKEERESES